jgi:hypothetical protein
VRRVIPSALVLALAVLLLNCATAASQSQRFVGTGKQPGPVTPTATLTDCGSRPDFVGKTLTTVRHLVRRCGCQLVEVYKVPDAAPAGTVVSESLEFNRVVVSTGPLTDRWAVLPGAKNPPVVAKCTATLQLDEDDNAGPLTCGADRVNVEAWYYFAIFRPPVMALPRTSSACQVAGYIALTGATVPIDSSAAGLASAYDGWHIPTALVDHILVGVPYEDRCAPFTAQVGVAPVDRGGRTGYGYELAKTVDGNCSPGSSVVGDAGYQCSAGRATFEACWRGTTTANKHLWQAVCLTSPWSSSVTVVVTTGVPAVTPTATAPTVNGPHGGSSWPRVSFAVLLEEGELLPRPTRPVPMRVLEPATFG